MAKSPQPTNLTCAPLVLAPRGSRRHARAAFAQGSKDHRIGVPTKTYWPTIVCEIAIRQSFREGSINAELTIYRSGAEGFEASRRALTDLASTSSSVALACAGRQRPLRGQWGQRLLRW